MAKVTDEKIKWYCEQMGYRLLHIGNLAFKYKQPNGEECALLKAAAHSLDHHAPNKPLKNG